jgi:hypothetical protein
MPIKCRLGQQRNKSLQEPAQLFASILRHGTAQLRRKVRFAVSARNTPFSTVKIP